MPDQGLFETPGTPAPTPSADPAPTTPSNDLFADQLQGITDEDGRPKYDTVPKALDALGNSQAYIRKLEEEARARDAETQALKDQVAKSEAVEDVVARLTAQNEQVQETPQPNTLDQDAVLGLVQKALNSERQEATRNDNLNSVYNSLNQAYGDKAKEVIAEKVQELGTTPEKLKELSKENPGLVIALFNGQAVQSASPTSSSINLPNGPNEPKPLERPQKSLLQGATSKEQADYMRKIKEQVYKEHGVEV